ncbi:hypothetical protein LJC61_01000 [Ruminococcaceae bacterium OttesenSCG-928-A16]|nr:hypothetical protein [Ruminococcaceae bacterium OttesenSCG-928-A16]
MDGSAAKRQEVLAMKKNKKKLFDDRRVVFALAFLLAVLAWIIIAGFLNPGQTTTITGVLINYRQRESNYKNLDLSLIGELPEKVSVNVKGDSGVIYKLNSASVTVYPDYSVVTGPGTYDVPLNARREDSGNFETVSISPSTISLRFERMEKKTLSIASKADGVEAVDGYFKDALVVAPSTIDITGPESEMAKVVEAVAEVPDSEMRDATKYYSGVQIKLLDEAGQKIDTTLFTLSVTEVEISVPILQVKEVPIVPTFSGAPSGFDTEWLKSLMTISTESIHVAAEKDIIDSFTECPIGPIDLSIFELGKEYEPFAISFPEKVRNKVKNLDQLKQVTVSFDTTNLVEKSFKIDPENIQIQNALNSLTITPASENGINVTLVGPKGIIDGLLPENIVVQVDAYGVTSAQGGQQSIAARVVVASSNRVFATGQYAVVCDIKVVA